MSNPNLLFITPELPYPPQSGGKVKSLKLLESLCERYTVDLASPLKLDDAEHTAELQAATTCRNYLHAELNVPRTAGNLARSYLECWPLNVRRTLHSGLRHEVAMRADQYDIIVLDHYEVFPYLPTDFKGTVVYHAHNAYFKLWERYAELPGNPAMRVAAALEAKRVRRYETSVGRRADLVFAAPNDAAELIEAGVPQTKIRDTFHLGDDTHLERPDLQFEQTREKLVYVGFLGWEANVQGLLTFLGHVWPSLSRRRPGLTFDIVGKNPDPRLQEAVAQHLGVRLLGFVPDLETVYADARISVAPLQFGSGMKVKVLDAMARGIPVVTTPVGAEGMAAEHGKHLMIGANAEQMVDNIDTLLGDQNLWETLRNESRQLVRERYTWRQLFRCMHRDIDIARTMKETRTIADYVDGIRHAG